MEDGLDWQGIFAGLLSVLSPGEAEAKVVARDPRAQQLINSVAAGANVPGIPSPRQQLYKDVLSTAEQQPETVSVGYDVPWTQHPFASGAYEPATQKIFLRDESRPSKVLGPFGGTLTLPAIPKAYRTPYTQDTLAHELQHFLLPLFGKSLEQAHPELGRALVDMIYGSSEKEQGDKHHAIIDFVQGQQQVDDTWSTFNKRPLFQQPPNMPSQAHAQILEEVLKRLIQQPAMLQQALESLQR